jgi:hypothetical protein
MARSRNIKPGFFSNEDLVDLDFCTRLLFAGLWTIADREGRLEDRPKKIKIDIFPADDVDVDSMLSDLDRLGFIQRYEVEGKKYVQVVAWSRHQNPHHTEKASTIPGPNGEITVKEPATSREPRKDNGGNLADSGFRIPDSSLLIPDSLHSEAKASGDKPPLSTDEIIFGYGVPLLTGSGSTDKAARSFLGGLRKGHGDTALVNALRDCIRAKPLQPIEWLAAALPPAGARSKPNAQEALEAQNREVGRRFLEKESMNAPR